MCLRSLLGLAGGIQPADSMGSLFKGDLEIFMKECERIRSNIQNELKKAANNNEEDVIEINIGASTSSAVAQGCTGPFDHPSNLYPL